jgi:hydrogenase expression/formation protein HypD
MSIKHLEEYRDPELARRLIERIHAIPARPVRLMEVCGTHTVSIFRSGIRSVLPDGVSLVSGPGCPVCVTDQGDIDAFIAISRMDGVIVATFGDLIRVPGTDSSLQAERAAGREVRVVYSAMDALDIARQHPDKRVVFLGVGFETTAPTIAATIMAAKASGLTNFLVYSAHKTVPQALAALVTAPDVRIDGFILPGHVSVIIGSDAYRFLTTDHHTPAVIAGFEPADILQAVYALVVQIHTGHAELENAYPRAVTPTGNPKAVSVMNTVFEPVDAVWRGIGTIAGSGLKIREGYADHDAARQLDIQVSASVMIRGCACGDILKGVKIPPECALYKTRCTPVHPIGPCMVSSEGTCAAYYRYS